MNDYTFPNIHFLLFNFPIQGGVVPPCHHVVAPLHEFEVMVILGPWDLQVNILRVKFVFMEPVVIVSSKLIMEVRLHVG